jgi:hypothetical protein
VDDRQLEKIENKNPDRWAVCFLGEKVDSSKELIQRTDPVHNLFLKFQRTLKVIKVLYCYNNWFLILLFSIN